MALMGTLVDNFDSGISGSWTASSGQVAASSGAIKVNHTAASQYSDLDSAVTYDLTASGAYVQITDVGNQSLVSHEVIFLLDKDFLGTDGLMFYITGGSLFAYKMVAGTTTAVGSSATYNATNHKWLRIRESSGTTFWDTSVDGISWTNFASTANPIALTSLGAVLRCGNWQTEATASYALFDNFNTLGAVVNTGQFFAML